LHSLCFTRSDPDPFARYLLPLLDGTRTPPELVEILATRSAAGAFAVHDAAGRPVTDPALARTALTGWVASALEHLARDGLLTA
jgi:hypothetical protein